MPGRALAFGCLLLYACLRDNRTAFVDALSSVRIPDLRLATPVGRVAAGDCPPGDLPASVAGHRERSPGNLLSLELDPLLFPTSPSLLWRGGSYG